MVPTGNSAWFFWCSVSARNDGTSDAEEPAEAVETEDRDSDNCKALASLCREFETFGAPVDAVLLGAPSRLDPRSKSNGNGAKAMR